MRIRTKEEKLESDEWGTPPELYDVYDREFDFDLDVCASASNFKCERYYTKEQNSLFQDWWGDNNWCNPPYSDQVPWVLKAIDAKNEWDHTTVMLQKYDPSTRHGQLTAEHADEIRIVEHRLKFVGATQGANFPSCIAVFRPRFYTRKAGARILYVNYRDLLNGKV